MIKEEIHLGDIGTVFEVTLEEEGVAVDVSTATLQQIIIVSPKKVKKVYTSTFSTSGIDGKIRFSTTLTSDLNEVGIWKIQAKVEMISWAGSSSIAEFEVYSNL